jgi:hypothetical protein
MSSRNSAFMYQTVCEHENILRSKPARNSTFVYNVSRRINKDSLWSIVSRVIYGMDCKLNRQQGIKPTRNSTFVYDFLRDRRRSDRMYEDLKMLAIKYGVVVITNVQQTK